MEMVKRIITKSIADVEHGTLGKHCVVSLRATGSIETAKCLTVAPSGTRAKDHCSYIVHIAMNLHNKPWRTCNKGKKCGVISVYPYIPVVVVKIERALKQHIVIRGYNSMGAKAPEQRMHV